MSASIPDTVLGMSLHSSDGVGGIDDAAIQFIRNRIDGVELGRTPSASEMTRLLAGAVGPDGLGADAAWALFEHAVVPNTVALDSPRFLAFIPMAPATSAVWMDAAVGVASFSAESWLEAAGAVAAENQALRFLADLAGFPAESGGCFTSGGSAGNLSALAVAREAAGGRRIVAVADTAHASVANALHLLGMKPLVVSTGDNGRFTGDALRRALGGAEDLAAIVASAGSTNAGVIDDIAGLADVAHDIGAWLHVDGAYGGAALLLSEKRAQFAGSERADSLIIDPHKWLFSTAGSCALLYRNPALAAAVHTQHGPYIDVFHQPGEHVWNPSDYAFQLTRRASGLPFWFTLVAHGSTALAEGVRAAVTMATYAAEQLRVLAPTVSLVHEPELSVVLFRRAGWDGARWRAWASDLLDRKIAFVAPTTWKGEPVGRLVFLHPETTRQIVDEIVGTLV
jgi:aromatic-L-amino-acid/L-tryptophan decarboxylase